MSSIAIVRARATALAKKYREDPRGLADVALSTAADDEQLAFELLRASTRAVLALKPREIEALLAHLHDWNSTDCFASFVSGVAWREGVLRDSILSRWARSEELWVRRAAIVSTVPLNLPARGARAPMGEAAKTLGVCVLVIDDHRDMIVKALSWALRTLASKDAKSVAAFVTQHQERLAARVVRETKNKLTTGLKNPRAVGARSTGKQA